MSFTIGSILLLLAFVCFVLAAFSVTLKKVSLMPLGLAFLTLSFLLEAMHVKLP